MATYQFQTEVNQLLTLIIHSLYSNKDIFLGRLCPTPPTPWTSSST